MLNRSDFEFLAEIVRGVRINDSPDDIASRLADWLAGKNPRFNRQKWLDLTRAQVRSTTRVASFALSIPGYLGYQLTGERWIELTDRLLALPGVHEVTDDGFVEFMVDGDDFNGAITRGQQALRHILDTFGI